MKRGLLKFVGFLDFLIYLVFFLAAAVNVVDIVSGYFNFEIGGIFETIVSYCSPLLLYPVLLVGNLGLPLEVMAYANIAFAGLWLLFGFIFFVWSIKTMRYAKDDETYIKRRKRLVKYLVFYTFLFLISGGMLAYLLLNGVPLSYAVYLYIGLTGAVFFTNFLLFVQLAGTKKKIKLATQPQPYQSVADTWQATQPQPYSPPPFTAPPPRPPVMTPPEITNWGTSDDNSNPPPPPPPPRPYN